MPSTRKQNAKVTRSKEMDMQSDYENMDVLLDSNNVNPIERELSNLSMFPSVTMTLRPFPNKERILHRRMKLETLVAKTHFLGQICRKEWTN